MGTRFFEVVQAATTLDRRTFIARFPDPMLLALSSIELDDGTPTARMGVLTVTPKGGQKLPRRARHSETKTHSVVDFSKPDPRELDPVVIFVASARGSREIHLGRGEQNDVILEDETVSREHATFALRNDWWTVLDRGSKNGTIVNGEPLVPDRAVPLGDGARIRFGKVCTYIFHTPVTFYAEINGSAV
jgi:hypothetical protein